ncbi:MAG: response regulator, partial [Nitrospinae bacterium]|nr:response regulator [Nitrospinota bacterium]
MLSNPLIKRPSNNIWVLVAQTSSFGIFLPLVGSVLFYLFFPDWRWPNEPFHSLIETLGGVIAISVAGLLLFLNNTKYVRKHHFWVGCGLISMGLLDIFHAGVPVGNTFVWFHSVATFLGGFFLGLIWLENKEWIPEDFKSAFFSIGGISILGASVFLVFPELEPAMLKNGTFTFSARALNILGGIGFLVASAWLAREVSLKREWEDYFLLIHCLLFGSAGILFELSELWDGPWWWWHFLRLLAYAAVFGFALKNYQEILAELKNFNEQLNIKIKERTNQLEEATLENELILQSAGEGIYGLDAEGHTTFTNQAAEKMLGYTLEEMRSQSQHTLIHHTHADGTPYPRHECPIFAAIEDGSVHRVSNEVFWRKDGTSFPVDYTSTPIVQNGEVTGAVVIFKDVAEQKKQEEKLRIAKDEAERANRAKSLFLANMSHEIRTPMNAVLGFSQVLLRKKHLDKETIDLVKTIDSSGKNLLSLINEILDISKIEAGKMELNLAAFDLNELIDNIDSLFELRCRQKKLKWVVKKSFSSSLVVHGDESKLRQVLVNLLGNAIKFTESGEVVFTVSVTEENNYRFDIIDTGSGIPAKAQLKIYDAFQQDEEGAKKGGTGLGLAISKKQLELMGSDLHLKSEINEGAHFYFTIELQPSSEEIKREDLKHHNILHLASGSNIKALVVDDIEENRRVLSILLSDVGIEVIEAVDGKEGVEKAIEHKPDIVFMDMRMPVMRGEEAGKQIQKHLGKDNVKIVVITASAFDKRRDYYLEMGFDEYIAKPFRSEQVFNCLNELLDVEFVYEMKNDDLELETVNNLDLSNLSIPGDLCKELIK